MVRVHPEEPFLSIPALWQFSKLMLGEARVTNDASQCEGIDGIVTRNRKNARAVHLVESTIEIVGLGAP